MCAYDLEVLLNSERRVYKDAYLLYALVPLVDTLPKSESLCERICDAIHPMSVCRAVPVLLTGLDDARHWHTKLAVLKLMQRLPLASSHVPLFIPALSSAVHEIREPVKKAAESLLSRVIGTIDNKDVKDLFPEVVKSIVHPEYVTECIHKLAATTFVQEVEASLLSVLVPLLLRGLRERQTAIKRKSALIIDNMAKLVEDAAVFLPHLVPELTKNAENVADPECREVTRKALQTLTKITSHKAVRVNPDKLRNVLSEVEQDPLVIDHLVAVACHHQTVEGVCNVNLYPMDALDDSSHDEPDILCDCEFSLAYGARILLNNAKMRLLRGRRYGLCGPNGAGKSTLLRSIANGQLDGFPPGDVLKTVYVEHDIDGSLSELSAEQFLGEGGSHALKQVGFSDELCAKPVASLSGGWKMKLALAKAMLANADILLLDEPTNHLDVSNVRWLMDYLTSLDRVTSIVVSHDSTFLDTVCTDILHYEGRKLVNYPGNLSSLVERVPEAKSYYDLSASEMKFKLPEPGFLEGVKSRDRAIIKMDRVSYSYPGTSKPVFSGVSVTCSLNSRIACLGANGAGKSTLIKVLTGEVEPTEGTAWRHPNVRIAYVAQHAFHHVEQHLDKTPVEYIQWRFATGEDREALAKETRQFDKSLTRATDVDGVKRTAEKILGRRKLRSDYEYEVQWEGTVETTWMVRRDLEELGYTKLVNEVDIREAAALGLFARPLTTANVQKHLEDLGMDSEISVHSRIRGLSGGQKVRLVLGAATWQQPHVIVLDEPTNYLDRDSLGALAGAIKDFGGGVVIITHHSEFSRNVCSETWTVAEGRVVIEGAVSTTGTTSKVDFKREEEVTDGFGNTIKIKEQKKNLSNKEKKQRKKLKQARRERGEVVSSSEDE